MGRFLHPRRLETGVGHRWGPAGRHSVCRRSEHAAGHVGGRRYHRLSDPCEPGPVSGVDSGRVGQPGYATRCERARQPFLAQIPGGRSTLSVPGKGRARGRLAGERGAEPPGGRLAGFWDPRVHARTRTLSTRWWALRAALRRTPPRVFRGSRQTARGDSRVRTGPSPLFRLVEWRARVLDAPRRRTPRIPMDRTRRDRVGPADRAGGIQRLGSRGGRGPDCLFPL